ncbi:MAG: hypothetical protein IKN72_11470 [Clostridia bacterium]|nr:hypothetical protein [Clostridia bacterium]
MFSLEQLFAPKIAGGDFPPSEPVAPGDTRVWVHWHGFTSSFVVRVTE